MYEHRLDSTIDALPEIVRDTMQLRMASQLDRHLFQPTLHDVLHKVEQLQSRLEAMEQKFTLLADRPNAVSEIQAVKEAHSHEVARLALDRDRHMFRANAAEAINATLIQRQSDVRSGGYYHMEQMIRQQELEERLATRLRTLHRPHPEASQFASLSTKEHVAPPNQAQDEPTLSELLEGSRPLKDSFLTESKIPKRHD